MMVMIWPGVQSCWNKGRDIRVGVIRLGVRREGKEVSWQIGRVAAIISITHGGNQTGKG
jgi:hypothetical protein